MRRYLDLEPPDAGSAVRHEQCFDDAVLGASWDANRFIGHINSAMGGVRRSVSPRQKKILTRGHSLELLRNAARRAALPGEHRDHERLPYMNFFRQLLLRRYSGGGFCHTIKYTVRPTPRELTCSPFASRPSMSTCSTSFTIPASPPRKWNACRDLGLLTCHLATSRSPPGLTPVFLRLSIRLRASSQQGWGRTGRTHRIGCHAAGEMRP